MTSILFKKQWKKIVILIVFFCCILSVRNGINSEFTDRYDSYQKKYMNQFDLSDRTQFFENLNKDKKEAQKIVSSIEYYESYDKDVANETLDDLMDILTGNVSYANYDMAVWKKEMLNMPGKYSETVSDDAYMLSQLSRRLANQNTFEESLENNIEIMNRGIRRDAGQTEKYGAVLSELQKVDTEFAVADTIIIDKILKYIEADYFIIILIVLSVFSIFSSVLQNKISNHILVSKMGMKKFALSQIAVTLGIILLGLVIYYAGVILALSKGNIGEIPWSLPIQAINGYENISFAFSVGQYFLISVVIKAIYCIFITSVVLLISILCKNTVISAVLSFAGCYGLVNLYNVWMVEKDLSYGSLLIGSSQFLWSNVPYLYVGGGIVPYVVVYVGIIVLLSLVMFFITVSASKVMAKKWVK